MVSRYALHFIAIECERVNDIGIDSSQCGCTLRSTHGLPCACELGRYVGSSIPLQSIHPFWRTLYFSDEGFSELEVRIKPEMDAIYERFEDLDICGKVTLKGQLGELAYPQRTSLVAPPEKVKTKGATKKQKSTKRDLSYFEHVDALHSMHDSTSTVTGSTSSSQQRWPKRNVPMLDQFHPCIQNFIENVVDVKADGNCGYRAIAALLGLGEESWSIIRNHLLKDLGQWRAEYIVLIGGTERYEQLK